MGKTTALLLGAVFFFAPRVFGGALDLPEWEAKIIEEVAQEYHLNKTETKLLYIIRKVENGRQGREFGVLVPQAMRYKNAPDKTKSFRLQAQWAAGTIKRRYKGDLLAFAKRWAPVGAKNDPKGLNKNWYKNARYYMEGGVK